MVPTKLLRAHRERWTHEERGASPVQPARLNEPPRRERGPRSERVAIADDGTRTEKGQDACVWLELDGVQLFSLPGELLDKFTDGAADAFTPPVPYKMQVSVLSTPTSAEASVARAFADARPPTPALRDLSGRLRAWWEEYLGGEYVPTHRFLLAISGLIRAPQGTTLARVVGEVERTLHRLGVAARRLDGTAVRALIAEFPDPLVDPAAHETIDGVYTPGQGARSWARTFYVRVPSIVTQPGWPAPLLAFPAPLRLTIHVAGLDQDKERTRAKKRGRSLGDLVVGAGAQGREADGDIGDARAEARAQTKKMRTGGLAVVRAGIYVTVFAPDQAALDVRADALWGLLTGTGAMDTQAARARGPQGPLLRATRPLGRNDAPRYTTYRMYAETVGNAWPAIVRSPGTAGGVLIGRAAADGALVRLDIGDRSFKNRLIDVFGGSGQGKSFFAQKVMLWFLLWDAWATAVDTVGGYETLCAIAGGKTIRLGGRAPPPSTSGTAPALAKRSWPRVCASWCARTRSYWPRAGSPSPGASAPSSVRVCARSTRRAAAARPPRSAAWWTGWRRRPRTRRTTRTSACTRTWPPTSTPMCATASMPRSWTGPPRSASTHGCWLSTSTPRSCAPTRRSTPSSCSP